jgi:hypothetical protein
MPRQRDTDETDRRLQKILQGAFAGPPTPLKDIPTATGKRRRLGGKPRRRRVANLKEQNKKNDNLNAALSIKFSQAKLAAVWTPIVAAISGGLAAIPYAALWGLWGAA